jgi:7-carboxy-7-deazaguanine synthase
MKYTIKEIYYTIQGEGANSGRPAVFCRFTGCNLWSGREQDRITAICNFCDTNFLGVDPDDGGEFEDADMLAEAVDLCWPSRANGRSKKFVVCTGGEPLLQMDDAVVTALKKRGFEIAVETNGTKVPPSGIDWVCVSPKVGAKCVVRSGDELKLVFPQVGGEPDKFAHLDFDRFFLQPLNGSSTEENTGLAIKYCLEHPQWELSLQTHKMVGIR